MGVQNLTGLMEAHAELFSEELLRGRTVVADGSALFFGLYAASRCDDRFGGDFPRFALFLRRFFKACAEADLRVVLILDGPADFGRRKRKTTVRRLRDRVRSAAEALRGGSGPVVPLGAESVLLEVAGELGVEVWQCAGEADKALALAARHLDAVLLSKDSDFFLCRLPAGYAPLDYFCWDEEVLVNGQRVIRAAVFRASRLLDAFPGLSWAHLPLVAAVFGNDFVPKSTFRRVLDRLPQPQRADRHSYMWRFLDWLAKTSNPDATLLGFFPAEKRDAIREVIDDTRKDYDTELGGPGTSLTSVEAIVRASFQCLANQPPDWLLEAEMSGGGQPTAKTATLFDLKIRYHRPVMSDFSQPSAYSFSRPIRKLLYTLVLGAGETVNEVGRKDGQAEIVDQPVLTLATTFPPLEDFPSLDSQAKLDILRGQFQEWMKEEEGFCWEEMSGDGPDWEGLELLWLSLNFWLRKSSANRAELAAVLLCAFRLQYKGLKGLKGLDFKPESLESRSKRQRVRGKTANPFKLNLRSLHSFAQLERALTDVRAVNRLLQGPLPDYPLHRLLSGRFLHNAASRLAAAASAEEMWAEARLLAQGQAPVLLPAPNGQKPKERAPEGEEVAQQWDLLLGYLKPLKDLADQRCPNPHKGKKKKRLLQASADPNQVSPDPAAAQKPNLLDPENAFALLGDMSI